MENEKNDVIVSDASVAPEAMGEPDLETISLGGLFSLYDKALNQLSSLQSSLEEELDAAMPDFVRKALEDVNARYYEIIASAQLKSQVIEDAIKQRTVAAGKTLEANGWRCSYYKGRVSWDAKGLEGFMVAHPEIEVFRKEGAPYAVSPKRVAKKE